MRRFATFLLGCLIATGGAATPEAIFVVVADQHSSYARTAQFVGHVDRVKAENPGVPLAVLINGDVFELGNAVALRSAGAVDLAMLEALAKRAPTVINLGNHEPEFQDVAETVKRLRATGVTVIGSLVDRATGAAFAPPATTLSLGQAEVVIVGVATDLIAQYRAAVRPQLDLANPAVWAKEKFPALLASAPIRIVLSHSGVAYDRQMFPVVPDGTLFAGGHDHLRFVHREGRTVYFHSGSWNSHVSVVRLQREAGGEPVWEVEQVAIAAGDPGDVELTQLIVATRARRVSAAESEVVGRLAGALDREAAARLAARAVRIAANVDAVLIGNTTFGDGLPAGDVTREAFDACVRFNGTICVAEVSGERLRAWMARANQNADTPFAERRGEFQFADGLAPAETDPARTYRMATTDWGMKNRGRYFGAEDLVFVERPELRLKAIVAEALNER